MKTFTFQVHGAGSNYDLTVDNETVEGAVIAAQGIAGRGRKLQLVEETEGSLEDFLGEDYFTRFATRKASMKRIGQWKGDRK